MNLTWIIIAIIAAGFLGSKFAFAKGKLPQAVGDLFLTGWEFIFIGVIAGPAGLALIQSSHLEQLDPFIALGLGWAGLLYGSQLRLADLNKIGPEIKFVTLVQAAATGLGLFFIYSIFAASVLNLTWGELFAASAVVAGAGAISSPTALSLIGPRLPRSKNPALRQLFIISTLDVGPAIAVIGMVFLFFPAQGGAEFSFFEGVRLAGFSFTIAAALAGLFLLFDRSGLSGEENLAVFIGYIIFISGIAFYLSISPLFLSLITGLFLANTLKPDDEAHALLHKTEKPFYIILLIMAGMWWSEGGAMVWAAAAALVLIRLWIKRVSVDAASARIFPPDQSGPAKGSGLALGAQGALALAIGLNFLLVYPGESPKLAFGVIAIMTIINEAAAPALIQRTLDSK